MDNPSYRNAYLTDASKKRRKERKKDNKEIPGEHEGAAKTEGDTGAIV